jgi:hypothetical protein
MSETKPDSTAPSTSKKGPFDCTKCDCTDYRPVNNTTNTTCQTPGCGHNAAAHNA